MAPLCWLFPTSHRESVHRPAGGGVAERRGAFPHPGVSWPPTCSASPGDVYVIGEGSRLQAAGRAASRPVSKSPAERVIFYPGRHLPAHLLTDTGASLGRD